MRNLVTGLIFFAIIGLIACICAAIAIPFVWLMSISLGFLAKFIGWPVILLVLFLVFAYLCGRDLNG